MSKINPPAQLSAGEPARRSGPSRAAPGQAQAVPAFVQLARLLLAAVAGGHLVALAILQTRSAGGASAGAWVLHLLLALLMVVFIWKLPTGHRWFRRPATMSQVLSIGFSLLLWSSPINYRPLIPVLDVAGLVAVVLLWLPNESRLFFQANQIARSRGTAGRE